MIDPADLTALQARELIVNGELAPVQLLDACLARIEQRDSGIEAWAFLDPEGARRQAEQAQQLRLSGRPIGPLHGLPVGVKDIIDTADMPTENGTPIDAGRRSRSDANAVSRLRAAGAIILGKTVTTELAYFRPGKTKNPHDAARTPGGSSSGSAAAVASGMVPLALGTQTLGSVIRPASFCGVVGFKPSFGLIGRSGILKIAELLDTVGVFARTVEDAALVADALAGYDPNDPQSVPQAPPKLLELALSQPPVQPLLAVIRPPGWDRIEPSAREALEELVSELGERCRVVDLPRPFADAVHACRTLLQVGFAHNLQRYYEEGRHQLSPVLVEAIVQGLDVKAVEYVKALQLRESLYGAIESVLLHFDSILTLAAPGEAPVGLESTGSPVCNEIWTYLGMPAVTLPLMEGPNGMPLGIQLVGRRGYDGRLLRTARWLTQRLSSPGGAAT